MQEQELGVEVGVEVVPGMYWSRWSRGAFRPFWLGCCAVFCDYCLFILPRPLDLLWLAVVWGLVAVWNCWIDSSSIFFPCALRCSFRVL